MQFRPAHVPPQPLALRLPDVLTAAERYRAILANHLPPQAVDWVYSYLDRHRVHFHITRSRTSKLGDYRRPTLAHPHHEMSINGDLGPDLFLWVFIHEAAHLETHLLHPHARPHGPEWQEAYRQLLVAQAHLLPPSVQPDLQRLVARLPLSPTLTRRIEDTLRRLDPAHRVATRLDDLPAGSRFRLVQRPTLLLVSVERRRTRWLCLDPSSGRRYTVSAQAEVQPDPPEAPETSPNVGNTTH